MHALKKLTPYLIAFFILVTVVGTILLVKDSQPFSLRAPEMVSPNVNQQPITAQGGYSLQTTADVEKAPSVINLGFNNAEQVVAAEAGTNMVWVANGQLQFVVRTQNGVVTSTTNLAAGNITLPALARSGSLVSVAWVNKPIGTSSSSVMAVVSTNGGTTFSEAVTIGTGSGVSLAASKNTIVATWQDDANPLMSKIMLSQYDVTSSYSGWSSPNRIDESNSQPLWASVAMDNNDVYVTWRDNRNGNYNIWLRRYINGVWETEQNVTSALSGDPDICVNGKTVAIAHHGQGEITLVVSKDGGQTFDTRINLGSGFFAHISCSEDIIAVAWEYATAGPKSSNKKTGWAIYTRSGENIDSGIIEDGNTAASTVYIAPNSTWVEFLWIKVDKLPLAGKLRHTILQPVN